MSNRLNHRNTKSKRNRPRTQDPHDGSPASIIKVLTRRAERHAKDGKLPKLSRDRGRPQSGRPALADLVADSTEDNIGYNLGELD